MLRRAMRYTVIVFALWSIALIACAQSSGSSTAPSPQNEAGKTLKTGSMSNEEAVGEALTPDVTSDISCTSVQDCWVNDQGPVSRPETHRGRDFRPCVDGAVVPVCVDNRCGGVVFGC